MKELGIKKIIMAVLGGLLGLFLFFSAVTTIPEGHLGVKMQFGKIVDDSVPAGLTLKIPFVQTIRKIDTREQVYEVTTNAYTKDTQTVEGLKIKLNYIYDKGALSDIIRNIGVENIETKIIIPHVNSSLKNAIGRYKAEDLVQNRSLVQEEVEASLTANLRASGIIVQSFHIENIDFEDSFEQVIRAKVEAEQEALRVQNETVKKEEEAKQRVIAAQAEADSIKVVAEAEAYKVEVINQAMADNPEYVKLMLAEKWDGHWPEKYVGSDNPMVLFDLE